MLDKGFPEVAAGLAKYKPRNKPAWNKGKKIAAKHETENGEGQ